MASQGDEMPESNPLFKELMGLHNWDGLLEPLDPSLRGLLLFCGDMCEVSHDAFINGNHTKYVGHCRYSKSTLLHKVFFPLASELTVSDYLYATSVKDNTQETNWIGYVAVSSPSPSTGRSVIYITWRGTERPLEWFDDILMEPVDYKPLGALSSHNNNRASFTTNSPKVMKGWYLMYTSENPLSALSKVSAREQVLKIVQDLIARYEDKSKLSVVCVGHSLGGALATLNAVDIVESSLTKLDEKNDIPVTAFVFGSPRVGNKAFKEMAEKHASLKILHVKNKEDMVPNSPPELLLGYVNLGVEIVLDPKKSPFLKTIVKIEDMMKYHNLQGILHTLAGWNGNSGDFKLMVDRCVALVNKSSEYLKDEFQIPASWWIEKNKGMVLDVDGRWIVQPPEAGDEELGDVPTNAIGQNGKVDLVVISVTDGNLKVEIGKKTHLGKRKAPGP